MRERVTTILGKRPVILVCPHGCDDTNTDIVTETAAEELECYAIINRGFDRSDIVDVDKDLANCNRIDHVKQDVVYDEFLKPIKRFVHKISYKNQPSWQKGYIYGGWYDPEVCHIFHIHGCGNAVHHEAQCQIELILGYGLGTKKHSLTCEEWRKNLLISTFRRHATAGEVYTGKGGGKYAGRDSNNMNQYYRKHENMQNVQSVQIEIPYSSRNDTASAQSTGRFLANAIYEYHLQDSCDDQVSEYLI